MNEWWFFDSLRLIVMILIIYTLYIYYIYYIYILYLYTLYHRRILSVLLSISVSTLLQNVAILDFSSNPCFLGKMQIEKELERLIVVLEDGLERWVLARSRRSHVIHRIACKCCLWSNCAMMPLFKLEIWEIRKTVLAYKLLSGYW